MGGRIGVITLLGWGALVAAGCGGRTGIELPTLPDELAPRDASDAATDDAADATDDGAAESSAGPGAGSGAGSGGVAPEPKPDCPWCSSMFPHCVVIARQRNCCNGPGPYDGPGGSCMPIP